MGNGKKDKGGYEEGDEGFGVRLIIADRFVMPDLNPKTMCRGPPFVATVNCQKHARFECRWPCARSAKSTVETGGPGPPEETDKSPGLGLQ